MNLKDWKLVGWESWVGWVRWGWLVGGSVTFFMEMNQCMLEIVRDQKGLLKKIISDPFGWFW